MQQARALAKTLLFVIVVAAVIELAVALPILAVFASGMDAGDLAAEVASALVEGAHEGLGLAIAMALVTVILFRDSRRLKHYGLAMVGVALVISLLRWGRVAQLAQPMLDDPHPFVFLAIGRTLARVILNLVNCRVAAGRYRRAVLRQASDA